MSAQTTISRPAQATNNGRLVNAIAGAAAAIAGLALLAALLGSTPEAPTTQPAPALNPRAVQAEKHHLPAPAFDAVRAPAPRHEPFPWNR